MIDIQTKIESLFQTFDQSGRAALQQFLRVNPSVTKWFIAADFCLHEPSRPNNVFSFSLIPYDAPFEEIKSKIHTALPKDWKKTKLLDKKAISLLHSDNLFHFSFVLPSPPKVFNNGNEQTALTVARESIAISISALSDHGRTGESLRRLKTLRQASQASSFNVKLLADIYVLSDFFCFVTLALARERPLEVVGWLPDRDKMTTWCEGFLFDLSFETVRGLAERLNITLPADGPIIGGPAPSDGKDAMWYDEFIRIPDYMAAIFSAWDFDTNLISAEKDKYLSMAQDFVALSKNSMVFKIRYDDYFQAGRIVFSTEPSKTDEK